MRCVIALHMSSNPYIGPRAFRAGENLPARAREQRELTDLVIAERIVLLHAPSGAGKTSLIQAGVVPLLREECVGGSGFQVVPVRISTPAPADRPVHNRYVYSGALDLLPAHNHRELESLTFQQVLGRAKQQSASILVLIFDQFEEILTLDPTDWRSLEMFFQELRPVLADGDIWALFSMREDYIGGLDRFVHYFPGYLQTTYRLDFLEPYAAKVAIQAPAYDQGVAFTDEATNRLLLRLTTVKVQRPGHSVETIQAPYVYPFELQVVCRRLWQSLAKKKGDVFTSIEVGDIESYADTSRALRDYYANTVKEVARTTGAAESAIREWFEEQLITRQHFRTQTQTGPSMSQVADRDEALRALQDAYLVRSDIRAGTSWYELSHDNLIEPILESNKLAR
jgi:Novel STAND NTPase 1